MSQSGVSLWLVTWGYYSEQASVAIVSATDEDEAKRRALALADDAEMAAGYLRGRLWEIDAEPVSDGLYTMVLAEH